MDRQLFECIDPSSRVLSTTCSLGKARRFSAAHWSTVSRSVPIVCGQAHQICRSEAWSFALSFIKKSKAEACLSGGCSNDWVMEFRLVASPVNLDDPFCSGFRVAVDYFALSDYGCSYNFRQRNELHFIRVSCGKHTEACNACHSENFSFHRRTNFDERLGTSIRWVTCFRAPYFT